MRGYALLMVDALYAGPMLGDLRAPVIIITR
jgi:hypothetical protein